MGKVTIREWYTRVNGAWPPDSGVPTGPEAVRAARRLYRYATGCTWTGPVILTSGNRYTWIQNGEFRVNPDRAPERGWRALVHDLSHWVHRRQHPDARPHSGTHARTELRLIKEVVKRGYLTGALVDDPKSEPPKPTAGAERAKKLARLRVRQRAWETKARRATRVLKKLDRQIRAAQRLQALANQAGTSSSLT